MGRNQWSGSAVRSVLIYEILLTLNVKFRHGASDTDLAAAIDRIERSIRSRFHAVKRIYIEANPIAAAARSGHE